MYTRFLYPRPVANGDEATHVGVTEAAVGLKEFDDESAKNAPELAFKSIPVPDTAVNGTLDGVKFDVYKPVPFMILKLVIGPSKNRSIVVYLEPRTKGHDEPLFIVVAVPPEFNNEPLTKV